jgi:hypothetical protein
MFLDLSVFLVSNTDKATVNEKYPEAKMCLMYPVPQIYNLALSISTVLRALPLAYRSANSSVPNFTIKF